MSAAGMEQGLALPTPSPSASASSPDVPKKRRRKPGNGEVLKRNGKVIGVLRKQLSAGDEHQEVMDLGRANATLVREEMAVALGHHLVFMSQGILSIASSPPVCDLNNLHRGLFRNDWRLREQDPRREVLIASLISLGARRSNHSSITGAIEGKRILSSGSTLSMPLEDLADLKLGWRREGVCRSLAQRAVDLAVGCNLLKDTSPEAKQATSILRVVLFAVHPRHPYLSDLSEHLHSLHSSLFPMEQFGSLDQMGLSPIEFDSYTALLQRKRPKISNIDLRLIYGWHWDLVPPAIEQMKIMLDRYTGRVVAAGVLRNLLTLQQLPECKLKDLPQLILTLGNIFNSLDCLEQVMTKFEKVTFKPFDPNITIPMEPAVLATIGVAPHLGVIPQVAEACLAQEIPRVLGKLAETQPKVRELMAFTKMRFLLWLKIFVKFINDPQFDNNSGPSRHSRAILLLSIEVYTDWLSLCVEAARQHSVNDGPLASVQFSTDHLKLLLLPLASASTIFARSARMHQDLVAALTQNGVYQNGVDDSGAALLERFTVSPDEIHEQNVAQSIVSAALQSLGQELLGV